MGDRLANLQQAVDRIDEEIGKVLQCASVYKVPAVGFSGADFLNTCLVAFSSKTPDLILENLQAIERALGREQASDGMYHDRPIDLDLIMVDDQVINTSTLTVPHPRLHERRFVLQPLFEIAPEKAVPNHDQTIAQLFKKCDDPAELSLLGDAIERPAIHFLRQFNRICVEGTIGC